MLSFCCFCFFFSWQVFVCGSFAALDCTVWLFLEKQQRNGQFMGQIYKGKTTWKTPFLQSPTQRTEWLNCSLFVFPPWSQYVGTNVPVTRTMDHTGVSRQRQDLKHKQHNYLLHIHAHTADMWRPARQSKAIPVTFPHWMHVLGEDSQNRKGGSCLSLK